MEFHFKIGSQVTKKDLEIMIEHIKKNIGVYEWEGSLTIDVNADTVSLKL